MQIDEGLLSPEERAGLRLRRLYADAGYRLSRLSRFEPYELYVANRDFLASDSVLTFTEPGGRLMALRPDVTLSLVKAYRPGQTQRLQYSEQVYRPGPFASEYREITQAGLECLGDIGETESLEVLLLALRSLEALGGSYVLTLSHQGLIDRALEGIRLPSLRRELLDCLSAKSRAGLDNLRDQAGLDKQNHERMALLIDVDGAPDEQLARLASGGFEGEALNALRGFCRALEQEGYAERLRLDFSIGADSRYYEGILFKGYLDGLPEGILAGGRYDPLMRRMGKQAGGIGFALYLDLLARRRGEEAGRD